MADSKRTFWQKQMDDWDASGQTQISFCAERSLNKNTFQYWRKRLSEADVSSSIGFLPVQIQTSKPDILSTGTVELILQDNFKIRLSENFCEATLLRIIRVLKAL